MLGILVRGIEDVTVHTSGGLGFSVRDYQRPDLAPARPGYVYVDASDFNTKPPPPTYQSVTTSSGIIYVQLACTEPVDGYILKWDSTGYGIGLNQRWSVTGYFEIPANGTVYLYAKTVRGTAESDWVMYADPTDQFTNVMTDTITGKSGAVPDFQHVTTEGGDLYYNSNRLHSDGDKIVMGYWSSEAYKEGAHGARVRCTVHASPTTEPKVFTGVLFHIPDAACTTVATDWDDEYSYFLGVCQDPTGYAAGFYGVIAIHHHYYTYTQVPNPDHYEARFNGLMTYVKLNPTYLNASGIGNLEFRAEDNTFSIWGCDTPTGTDFSHKIMEVTDATYPLSATRDTLGIWKFADGWFDDDFPFTVDLVNYPTGEDRSILAAGKFYDSLLGTLADGKIIEWDADTETIVDSGKTVSDFAPADHHILSASHGDSTAASVVRGDIIIGSGATPKWTRFAKGAAGTILNMGADEPQWSTQATLLGSGTNNYIPKFLVGATPTFANSIMSDAGAGTVSLDGNLTLTADAVSENRTLTIQGWDAGTSAVDTWTFSVGTDGRPRMFWGGERFLHLTDTTYTNDDLSNLFIGYKAGSLTCSGYANVAIGHQSLKSITSGEGNTATGSQALQSVTSGGYNSAYGDYAGASITTTSGNCAFGAYAMLKNNGTANCLFGHSAGLDATSASYQTGFGYSALYHATTPYHCAFGGACLLNLTSGNYNCGFGYLCLQTVTTGSQNCGFGHEVFYYATGDGGAAFGCFSLRSVTSGADNTAIGRKSGYEVPIIGITGACTTGSGNTFLGAYTGFASSTQYDYTTVIGYGAYAAASNAIILGRSTESVGFGGITAPASKLHGLLSDATTDAVTNIVTLDHATSGTPAAGFGSGLLFRLQSSTTVNQDAAQIAVSWTDATHASRTSNVEIFNVVNGTLKGYLHSYGGNLFLGVSSGNRTLSSASSNVGIGPSTLPSLTTGKNNVCVGAAAGSSLASGGSNFLLGENTGRLLNTGSSNIIIGTRAAFYGGTGTGFSQNTVIGSEAIYGSGTYGLTGYGNTIVGYACCQTLHAGSLHNTAIGNVAGPTGGVTVSRTVSIGQTAGYGETNSNRLNIHASDADTRTPLIYGDFSSRWLYVHGDFHVKSDDGTTTALTVDNATGIVVNEDGADRDFRVESDTEANMLVVDAGTDIAYLGGTTNGVKIEKGGNLTLIGTATQWEDLRLEPVVRGTGSNNPVFEQWYTNGSGSVGLFLYSFTDVAAANEKEVWFTMQMPHAWAQTAVYIHVHWVGSIDDTTASPLWGLEYNWAEIGAVFGNSALVYTDGKNYTASGDDADITAHKHYISKFAAITPSASQDGISSILIGRLFRNSSSASDTYDVGTNKCGLLYIDTHYEVNSFGSNTEYTK